MRGSLVAQVFSEEWPRVVATLAKDLGDLDLAEDAAQEAFLAAGKAWPANPPHNPGAWLVTTARRKAIDTIRRDQRFADRIPKLAPENNPPVESHGFGDDELALLLGCCHPALSLEAQVALTLRVVAGLSPDQIAHAFLVSSSSMAKRLTRAKTKIRHAGIPLDLPEPHQIEGRVSAALRVIYLVFTEGHAGSSESLIRGDLCEEARWLGDLLGEIVPNNSEVHGLAALMAFTDARRPARTRNGEVVLLEDQNRFEWDQQIIQEGHEHLRRATECGPLGFYGWQAEIAKAHAEAASYAETDWAEIVHAYDELLMVQESPVVELNRAVAVSKMEGPSAGLALLDGLSGLSDYRYYHTARAALLEEAGRSSLALDAWVRALALASSDTERTFVEKRIASLGWPARD